MKKAIIFDFNGVIISDEHIQRAAFNRVVSKHGINLDRKQYVDLCLGRTSHACFQKIYDRYRIANADIENDLKEKREIYDELTKKDLTPSPGLIEFIKRVERKYKLAIASGGNKSKVRSILGSFGINDCFEVIITAEDSEHSKPDPDPFLKAAHQMGLAPESCLVIEDSERGIEAAKAAGMKCVAITHTRPRENLCGAEFIISSFSELSDELLASL